MRLTPIQIADVFGDPNIDSRALRENWYIAYRAQNEGGLELRDALELVRNQPSEMSAFVEKILQPADLADVEFVIEILVEEDAVNRIWDRKCLRMLQAWRARTLMQIVIDKRNAMSCLPETRSGETQ